MAMKNQVEARAERGQGEVEWELEESEAVTLEWSIEGKTSKWRRGEGQ